MLCYKAASGSADGVLGVFFVRKKDGRFRLIFDTRLLNRKFVPPPKTQLPSAAGFSNLAVHEGGNLYLASSDVKNAFYVLEIPTSLAHMFTLPSIQYTHVKHFCPRIESIGPNDYICPCLKVLPMGWSWSLHLCQS